MFVLSFPQGIKARGFFL